MRDLSTVRGVRRALRNVEDLRERNGLMSCATNRAVSQLSVGEYAVLLGMVDRGGGGER